MKQHVFVWNGMLNYKITNAIPIAINGYNSIPPPPTGPNSGLRRRCEYTFAYENHWMEQ